VFIPQVAVPLSRLLWATHSSVVAQFCQPTLAPHKKLLRHLPLDQFCFRGLILELLSVLEGAQLWFYLNLSLGDPVGSAFRTYERVCCFDFFATRIFRRPVSGLFLLHLLGIFSRFSSYRPLFAICCACSSGDSFLSCFLPAFFPVMTVLLSGPYDFHLLRSRGCRPELFAHTHSVGNLARFFLPQDPNPSLFRPWYGISFPRTVSALGVSVAPSVWSGRGLLSVFPPSIGNIDGISLLTLASCRFPHRSLPPSVCHFILPISSTHRCRSF